MRKIPILHFTPIVSILTVAPWAAVPWANAADHALLEQKLSSKYKLSSVNAEGDFVITGTTLLLKKGGMTGGVDPVTCIHDYKDGKLSLAGASKAACTGAVRTLSKIPGINLIPGVGTANQTAQGAAPTTRPFVAGEKLYMTKIDIAKDNVELTVISELINMVRYRAQIRFQKAATLEVPEAENVIAEAIGVDAGASGGSGGSGAAPSRPVTSTAPPAAAPVAAAAPRPVAAAAPAPVAAQPLPAIPPPPPPPADAPRASATPAIAPIPPPPPPSDQPAPAPPTISAGMTTDQVVAMLGQPDAIADLGAKKIYSYKTLKVTFVDGKVAPTEDSSPTPAGSGSSPSSNPNMLMYEVGGGILIIGGGVFLLSKLKRPAQ